MDRKHGSLDPRMNVQVDHTQKGELDHLCQQKHSETLKRKLQTDFSQLIVLVPNFWRHHLHAISSTPFLPYTHSNTHTHTITNSSDVWQKAVYNETSQTTPPTHY